MKSIRFVPKNFSPPKRSSCPPKTESWIRHWCTDWGEFFLTMRFDITYRGSNVSARVAVDFGAKIAKLKRNAKFEPD